MKKRKLDLSQKANADRSRNESAIIAASVMNLVLIVAYYLEAVKENRSFGSFFIIAALCLLPCVLSVAVYFRKRDSVLIRYFFMVFFMGVYAYIMFTSVSWMPFCYVVVMLSIFIVYVDLRLCAALGIYSVVVNVAMLYVQYTTTGLDNLDIVNGEVMLACLLLNTIFSIAATRRVMNINQATVEKMDYEKTVSQNMLNTTMEVAGSIHRNMEQARQETRHLEQAIADTQQSMQRLNDGAQDSARSIQAQQASTQAIDVHMRSVTQATERIAGELGNAEERLDQSNLVMNDLLEQVQVSQSSGNLVAETMERLSANAQQMQQIVGLIHSVASQTTLLSFNATIEAARAGAAGKGFAVVAGQVSELAKQTNEATRDIEGLIEELSASIGQVAQAADVLLESNRKQNEQIERTAENFAQIRGSTQTISEQAGHLQTAVEAAAQANEEVIANIDHVAGVTREVTDSADETLVNCNQNMSSIQVLTSVMELLEQQAVRLNGETP